MRLGKFWRQLLSALVCAAASILAATPVAAQENVRAIGAVIAPPELVAAYSCTTYGEAMFLPKVQERARRLVEAGNGRQAALARLLARYDRVLDDMCRETATIFARNRDRVLDAYARQLPGTKSDIAPFLANPRSSRWASENVAFLTVTAPLIQYYALTKSVAPELLKDVRASNDRSTDEEVRGTSVGMEAQYERAMLILLLADDGFRGVVPPRFDLTSLRQDEVRLRKEAGTLKYSTSFGWFNDNASDLVRRHFGGFDVMREMGLADVYAKYSRKIEEELRQN